MSAAEIRQWGRDVRSFADTAPGDAIVVVDDAISARLNADTGGDGMLSRGRKLGRATTQITKRPGEAQVEPSGSRQVWGILQGGTVAHVVEARKGHVLATPYGPRPRVHVSGAPARRTFTEGAERGLVDAQRRLESDWGRL
jgi:hypothetical protein